MAVMFAWLRRLVLYRLFGGRILIALAVLGWLRGRLFGRRDRDPGNSPASRRRFIARSGYQPSHGASQTVQRDPR